MRSFEGQTALVTGGGRPAGRAIALALAARGVRIVVTGRDEKALGETVGEVVHGGGKARHLAGDPSDASHLDAAVNRAVEVFGGLDIVVAADPMTVEYMLSTVARRDPPPGRVIVVGDQKGIGCNVVSIAPNATEDDVAGDAAELVVFLCSPAGGAIQGQTIAVGHAVRTPIGG